MQRKLVCIFVFAILAVTPVFSSGNKKSKSKSRPKITNAKRGKDLYRLYQCADCHSIKNEGNNNGVRLDQVGLKRSRKFLLEQLLDPENHAEKNSKSFNGDPNLMPSQQLEKSEAEAIVDFLKTLR